ncbi:MAG TPA: OmpA family protein [Terriglobales bacterium]|nr:OmpA family protein [Terriglobales bacterium]
MKKLLAVMLLWAVACYAQEQRPPDQPGAPAKQAATTNLVEKVQAPTYSDIYCAGFVTSSLPTTNYIAGGWRSPEQSRFADRDLVYLAGGGLQDGAQYSVVRELKDPNHSEAYRGQRGMISGLGAAYAELGRVRVLRQAGNVHVGVVEFSCDSMVPGDILVPWSERPKLTLKSSAAFDRFAAPNGKLTARIVMAKDFDWIVATGQKVYLNAGSEQGVKAGDYFRAVRTYSAESRDTLDSLTHKASIAEDTQKNPASMGAYGGALKINPADYPRKSIGEMIVLNTTPKTSTAMITFALEEMRVGDVVEMEEPPPPAPAAAAPPPQGPQIACSASPASVRVGDSATVNCEAMSPDNRPVTIAYAADRGRVSGAGARATLNTQSIEPGPVTITATTTDDRNMSASATAMVSVEAPPPPPSPSKAADVMFKPNGAYVDNRAKAVLDDIALRLQRESDSRATVVGMGHLTSPAGNRVAMARAENVRTYLTRDKGIDPQRITTKTGDNGDKAEVWLVPAGAQMP